MNIPLPIRNLANNDRKLLETVLDAGFDFRQVVTKSPSGHPAQQSLMNFLLWFGQPHIKQATDVLLALFHRVEHLSATARQARARTVLEKSLHLIHSITPTAVPTDNSDESEKARRHAQALARESRLIAARLTPAGLLKDPDAPPRPAPLPRTSRSAASAATTLIEKAGAPPAAGHHSAPTTAPHTRATLSPHHVSASASPSTQPSQVHNSDTPHPDQPIDQIALGPNLAALLQREESLSLSSG
jgi:hypothetical protein